MNPSALITLRLCESQDVDLDRHEADSPPWTCDPDSIKELLAKLAKTEQQLTKARELLAAMLGETDDDDINYDEDELLAWLKVWRKQTEVFLARTPPHKQLNKGKETK